MNNSFNTPPVYNNPYMSQPSPVITTPKEPRKYSLRENLFAWMCYVFAYLFCLAVPISVNPLGAFIVIILMFVSTAVVLLIKGNKVQTMPIVVAVSALVCSSSLILTSNSFLHFFAFCYGLASYCYFVYGVSSEHKFKFNDMLLADFMKALFVLPFYSFADVFRALFSGKNNKGGRFALKVLCGIVLAIVPTAIVLLLLAYDNDFANLMEKMFKFENFSLFEHIVSLIFAFPVSAYLYGIFISSRDNKCTDILTPESCKKGLKSLRFAPLVTVLCAVMPVLFVYVVFFVSQWKYYVSGFTRVLPKNFSYATYAREGFFELCTVAFINLIILILISVFLKRKSEKSPVMLKVLSVVFSVFTLVLISTAIAKMVMYIDCYGLTPKRVYSSWFMIVLALVFLLIIVKQFVHKMNLIAYSFASVVVLFTALCVSNVDSFIANYNVNRYLDGTLKTVDVESLEELQDASIPSMVRLYEKLLPMPYDDMSESEKDMFYELERYLDIKGENLKRRDDFGNKDIWSYTIPSQRAEIALKETKFY